MPRVFINHKSEDKSIAIGIKEHLTRCLISAWLDSDDMPAGAKLVTAIGGGIASSRYFIALLSKRYVRSNWCLHELEAAENRTVDRKVVILPVLLDDPSVLELDDLDADRRNLIDSVIGRKMIRYDQYDPAKSRNELAEAIAVHEGLGFAPIETKKVGGVDLQVVSFEIKQAFLPPSLIKTLEIGNFVSDDASKPLRDKVPVAITGAGPNWLFSYLALPFKNRCPVYVYNNRSDDYVCVYDTGEPPGRVGSVLKTGHDVVA